MMESIDVDICGPYKYCVDHVLEKMGGVSLLAFAAAPQSFLGVNLRSLISRKTDSQASA